MKTITVIKVAAISFHLNKTKQLFDAFYQFMWVEHFVRSAERPSKPIRDTEMCCRGNFI